MMPSGNIASTATLLSTVSPYPPSRDTDASLHVMPNICRGRPWFVMIDFPGVDVMPSRMSGVNVANGCGGGSNWDVCDVCRRFVNFPYSSATKIAVVNPVTPQMTDPMLNDTIPPTRFTK
jgi:hypothetical protein